MFDRAVFHYVVLAFLLFGMAWALPSISWAISTDNHTTQGEAYAHCSSDVATCQAQNPSPPGEQLICHNTYCATCYEARTASGAAVDKKRFEGMNGTLGSKEIDVTLTFGLPALKKC